MTLGRPGLSLSQGHNDTHCFQDTNRLPQPGLGNQRVGEHMVPRPRATRLDAQFDNPEHSPAFLEIMVGLRLF